VLSAIVHQLLSCLVLLLRALMLASERPH